MGSWGFLLLLYMYLPSLCGLPSPSRDFAAITVIQELGQSHSLVCLCGKSGEQHNVLSTYQQPKWTLFHQCLQLRERFFSTGGSALIYKK